MKIQKLKRGLFLFFISPLAFIQKLIFKYHSIKVSNLLGGGKRVIQYPYKICGIENVKMSDNIYIGPGSTIYTTGAKLIFHPHVTIGPNLTIITGDHMPMVGRFIDEVTGADKTAEYDKDVTIESDVWIGCNVTILKGVTIGHGSIVAAGSVVTKSCAPYSLIGGVPAKLIKQVYSKEEIIRHEKILYGGYYNL